MPKKHIKSPSKSYEVGYRRPPKNFRFRKGRSGNPTGKRKTPLISLDLKAQLAGHNPERQTSEQGCGRNRTTSRPICEG